MFYALPPGYEYGTAQLPAPKMLPAADSIADLSAGSAGPGEMRRRSRVPSPKKEKSAALQVNGSVVAAQVACVPGRAPTFVQRQRCRSRHRLKPR